MKRHQTEKNDINTRKGKSEMQKKERKESLTKKSSRFHAKDRMKEHTLLVKS